METAFGTKNAERAVKRALKRSFRRGRLGLAALLDALFSCAILAAAVYLTVRPRFRNGTAAALASLAVFSAAACVLTVIRRERFLRHTARERRSAEIRAIETKALLCPEKLFESITPGKDECLFRGTDTLTADDLRELIRGRSMPLTVITLAEPTQRASELIARIEGLAAVSPIERLERELPRIYPVTNVDIDAAILQKYSANKRKTPLPKELLKLTRERAFKYLLVGAGLFAFSFFARYTLYFRMISSICLSLGTGALAAETLKKRAEH